MMSIRELAKSYAAALFSFSQEMLKTDEYKIAMELIFEVFKENPKYIEILSSPCISVSRRIDAIDRAFGDVLPREIGYFLKILCKNKCWICFTLLWILIECVRLPSRLFATAIQYCDERRIIYADR